MHVHTLYIHRILESVTYNGPKKGQRSRVDNLKNSDILNAYKHVGKYRDVLL